MQRHLPNTQFDCVANMYTEKLVIIYGARQKSDDLGPGFSNHGSAKIGLRRTLLWVAERRMGRMHKRTSHGGGGGGSPPRKKFSGKTAQIYVIKKNFLQIFRANGVSAPPSRN